MKRKDPKSHTLKVWWDKVTANIAALVLTDAKVTTTLGALHASITTDATGAQSITVPYDCEVIDVIVQSRATSGSGTATLRKVTTAITDAIVMAADTVITRAGTIDDAQSSLSAGDDLNVITNGAADRGLVTVVVRWL